MSDKPTTPKTATSSTGTTKTATSKAAKPLPRPNLEQSKKTGLSSMVGTVMAILIATLWTIPTAGLFINSLRPEDDIGTSGWWTVFTNPAFTTDTYNYVLYSQSGGGGMITPFLNTIVIALPSVIIPIVLGTMAAYALAWIPFRGRNFVFIFIFALQIIPIHMALVPLLSFFSVGVNIGGVQIIPGFGLEGLESYIQIWVAHTVFGLPLVVFLLHNFIREVPKEVVEAARVDGADTIQIFRKVILPLSAPAIASIAIFQFLWTWNDFLVGKIFGGGPDTTPLIPVLGDLAGQTGEGWTRLPAAAFISVVIPLTVFIVLQRYFVRGLMAGSVKG